MSVQENIRRLDSQGVPGREIARRLGVSRDSVARYADQQDFSPEPPAPRARPGGSVLTGFEHIIEQWLGEDQRRPRKQRHTAKRIFDRLVEEHGFTGSYSPVQRHVKKWTARNRQAGEGFTELVWPAGTVQLVGGAGRVSIAGRCLVPGRLAGRLALVPGGGVPELLGPAGAVVGCERPGTARCLFFQWTRTLDKLYFP